MKSQPVRLVDVFLLGPALIYIGLKQRKPAYRDLLIIAGGATILYNGFNYLQVAKENPGIAPGLK